jgi:hypothetical protein
LGLLDSESDYEYFLISQALHPSIFSFAPAAFYFDRATARIITLIGENLIPDAEIYLESITEDPETGEKSILRPSEIIRNDLGENARLVFTEEDLIAGKFEIVAINPGGLETRAGVFTIAVAKPFDVNVSGGYSPLFTLYGQKQYFQDRFFIPVSFSLRSSFIPLKMDIGNLGAEVNVIWSLLSSERNGFKTSAHLVTVNFDVLFQYWINRKVLSLNARAGLGYAGVFNYVFHFDTGQTWDPINTSAFTLNLGASVQWMAYKQIFIEGGVDFNAYFHREIPMGFLRLGLFAGYQF